MDISATGSYSDVLLQWQNGLFADDAASTAKNSAGKNQAVYADGLSMTDQVSGMIELTRYAMDAMGLDADSRVTFSQLAKYREQMQSEFNQGVSDGLKALGIEDTDSLRFTLQISDDGSLSVAGDSPDKDKIQNFFDNNPELLKKYRQIEALNGIDAAREALRIAPGELRKRIQIESMAAWWTGSGSAAPTIGAYAGGLSLLDGVNLTV
ncbi:MAG: hypothetical protein LBN96_08025 [Desulfovibrio sp.]|jgi:hypothetical protein|nr:hypothetical protein [Desulfovibrio sp.]